MPYEEGREVARGPTAELLDHRHRDIIHQLSFDIHGRRIATCSSDATVGIYDRTPKGTWLRTAHWKSHGGPIWRVEWAHPEFGQVLATCSFDRAVHIWEETPEDDKVNAATRGETLPLTRWTRKAALVDSRSNVTDVKFAPRHLGLQLATASTQGIVRVYECPDVMELTQWSLSHEIQALHSRCGSISWCESRMHNPLVAAATDEKSEDEKVTLFEYHESLRKWQHVSTARFGLTQPVTEVRFSPSSNIDYHILAVAAADIFIYQIKVPQEDDENAERVDAGHATEYTALKVAVLGDDKRAWRLSWNLTGNTLTSVSENGTMRVWRAATVKKWALVSEMNPDEYLYDPDRPEELPPPTQKELATTGQQTNTKASSVYY